MLPMAVVLPTVGKMSDLMDGRIPITFGILFSALSLYWLSFVNLRTSNSTGYWMLIMRGFGLGFIFLTLINIAINSLGTDKRAAGSGLMNVSRQIGGVFRVAVIW